jgi:hypothetical protein
MDEAFTYYRIVPGTESQFIVIVPADSLVQRDFQLIEQRDGQFIITRTP